MHNINVYSRRAGKGDIKEVLNMREKIGIGICHENYEQIIEEAEILMRKYGEDENSANMVLGE